MNNDNEIESYQGNDRTICCDYVALSCDTTRDNCSPSLELTTLTALLLSPGSFVPLITFFFLSPQVISACFDLLDGVLQ